MPVKIYIIGLFFLFTIGAAAQPASIHLKGQVRDSQGRPIAYASLQVPNRGLGTICNQAGLFSLYLPAESRQDSLLVSMLGYASRKIAIASIQTSIDLLIELDQKAVQLQEVTVRPPDPLELIQQAKARIPLNYFDQPHVLNGFYRIDTRKGEAHIMLSEAVFDIFNPGYSPDDRSQFRLIRIRSIQDEQAMHGLDFGLKPGSIYDYDIVKMFENSGLLGKEGLKNHQFKLRGTTDYYGTEAWLITFDQKDGLKESGYKGRLWLDANTLAFIAFDYSLSPKGVAYAQFANAATRALMKLLGIGIDTRAEHHLIRYKKFGNRWMLSDVRNDHVLRIRSNRGFYDFNADIRVDYLVTGVDTLHQQAFTSNESLGNNKFIENQPRDNDTSFWKDYNTILPDYNTTEIVQQIRERNASFSLKNKVEKRLSKWPKDPAIRLDSIFSFYHANGAFNGTVLVKQKGKVIFQKGYGYANRGTGALNADSTRFRIGSLTKTFTSLLIRQLEQEGKLSLQDSAGKFLPGYVHGGITIEQLLTHTSGIPNYTNKDEYIAELIQKPLSTQELIRKFCSDPLEFAPGNGFRYSNSGYLVLAGIIEKISSQHYADVLQQKIFGPLKMEQSGFSNAPLNSVGYWMGEPEPAYPLANTAGAGGIWSSVTDLLKYDEAMYSSQLLPAAKLQESFVPRADYADWDADYGYGWMIDRKLFSESKSHTIIYHPGTDFGYYSMFVRQPDQQNLVVMLSNNGDFPRFDLTDLVLELINKN